MIKIALSVLLISTSAFSTLKVIYGEDNRQDLFEVHNQLYLKLAKSTAAMIPNKNIKKYNGKYEISKRTLRDNGVCKGERFAEQPVAANCSGFLVDNDKIVTAGHCVKSMLDCENAKWVFNYKLDYRGQSEIDVNNNEVYECKKIISQEYDHRTKNDYALIQLKRKVKNIKPLKFRKTGKAKVGDKLVVIGHPSGLPTKVADGSTIRSMNSVFFLADLDTFGGNSGSAVFNADTGVIEGILVRGARDYNYQGGCKVVNVFDQNKGDGEGVTLITNIKELNNIQTEVKKPWWWRFFNR